MQINLKCFSMTCVSTLSLLRIQYCKNGNLYLVKDQDFSDLIPALFDPFIIFEVSDEV